MTIKMLAAQLDMPVRILERQSVTAWIDRRLLEIESEKVGLAHRYGAETSSAFLRLAKRGKIQDDTDTIEDFFKLDYLEKEAKRLRWLKRRV